MKRMHVLTGSHAARDGIARLHNVFIAWTAEKIEAVRTNPHLFDISETNTTAVLYIDKHKVEDHALMP